MSDIVRLDEESDLDNIFRTLAIWVSRHITLRWFFINKLFIRECLLVRTLSNYSHDLVEYDVTLSNVLA